MGTDSVPETLENLHTLKQPSAGEYFIKFISCFRRPQREKTANNRPTPKRSN
jgi:hypothetical protein